VLSGRNGSEAGIRVGLLPADSVEKLLHLSFAHILEGASLLAPDEIVDPGSICEVEFSISARRRADIEFFNRIGHVQSFVRSNRTTVFTSKTVVVAGGEYSP